MEEEMGSLLGSCALLLRALSAQLAEKETINVFFLSHT
jgi:hypothetical protein